MVKKQDLQYCFACGGVYICRNYKLHERLLARKDER